MSRSGSARTTPPPSPQFTPSALTVLNVLSTVLAVRFTLIVAVVGAIWLALLTIQAALPFQLAALGIYGLLVVVPLIWLSSRK